MFKLSTVLTVMTLSLLLAATTPTVFANTLNATPATDTVASVKAEAPIKVAGAIKAAARVITPQTMAQEIQQNFESKLYQLPPRIQGHYGIRLYRITGQSQYLNAALYDYYAVADRVTVLLPWLGNDSKANRRFAQKRSQQLTQQLSKGKRGKARRHALKKYPEFIFYADELLRYGARLHEFGVAVPPPVLAALSAYDFQPALTDPVMIKAWAAQLANYAYWLKQLGIVDLTDQALAAFWRAYPNENDAALSKWQFRNKLYGLTHFIFAASGYYQQPVSQSYFAPILDYFVENKKRIFQSASADVVAEIGVNFLLAGGSDHPMVQMSKEKLLTFYDPQSRMIPSVSGKVELSSGEHRNVLALMLLNWTGKLYPGPLFHQLPDMQRYLPQSPAHWLAAPSTNNQD